MVFQHFNLFPHMTALGNIIEAPIHVLGKTQREAEEEGLARHCHVNCLQAICHQIQACWR
jgi:ABC-type histidine transport system ATPase subunit